MSKDKGTLKLNFAAQSDRGLVRGNNEDSAYAGPHLLLLADGMGGHAAGEVASQLMVEHMEHLDRDPEDADILALLAAAAEDANASIEASIAENPEQDGMGTTLSALMFSGTEFGLIHVGDSRGYRLRDGELTQITVDDTFVQSLVEQGKLQAEDVSSHPQKSLILKAYTGRPVEPHLEIIDAQPGDRYLLCSDGLSDPVTHETIESTLAKGTPSEAAQRLIELALRSGGPDNVTVVIADVVDTAAKDAPELPQKSALAGALALIDEPSHPDTAAGRAAKLVRSQNRPQKTAAVKQDKDGASDGADSDDEEDHPRRRTFWTALIALLAVVLLALGGWWWLDRAGSKSYFVATNDAGEFVIEKGFNTSVFGTSLHTPVQQICINRDNQITVVDVDEVPENCQRFAVSDLPDSTAGRVHNLDSGSYADITDQINRLADEALPVCVDKENEPAEKCREVA